MGVMQWNHRWPGVPAEGPASGGRVERPAIEWVEGAASRKGGVLKIGRFGSRGGSLDRRKHRKRRPNTNMNLRNWNMLRN